MKRNSIWRFAVGAALTAAICACTGCGQERDGSLREQAVSRKEDAAAAASDVAAGSGSSQSPDLAAGSGNGQSSDQAAENGNSQTADRTDGDVGDATEDLTDESGTASGASGEVSLEGLTVSIHGDSISTYENWIPYGYNNFYPMSGDVTDVLDTWWIQLFDDTGMKLCANASSAGSTCAGDSTDAEDPQVGCDDFRVTDLSDKNGAYPDIIIVFIGTNDLLGNITLGDNDGTRAVEEGFIDNFADAYTLMLDKLENYYPAAEIYCCTLLQTGDYGTETPYVPFTNGQGLTAEDYSRQIEKIAEHKGYPAVDLYHCGIETDNLQEMTSDGVHPTPKGMKCIAEAVGAAIRDTRSR